MSNDLMQVKWETPSSTSQNNSIKFFLSSISMYPLVEFFIDSLVSRVAARQILHGETICPHSTRIGSFALNTVYWGSSRYRLLILLGTFIYNALALAGEYGFDSIRIDRYRSGTFAARVHISYQNGLKPENNLNFSKFVPLVPAGFLGCFQNEIPTDPRHSISSYAVKFHIQQKIGMVQESVEPVLHALVQNFQGT